MHVPNRCAGGSGESAPASRSCWELSKRPSWMISMSTLIEMILCVNSIPFGPSEPHPFCRSLGESCRRARKEKRRDRRARTATIGSCQRRSPRLQNRLRRPRETGRLVGDAAYDRHPRRHPRQRASLDGHTECRSVSQEPDDYQPWYFTARVHVDVHGLAGRVSTSERVRTEASRAAPSLLHAKRLIDARRDGLHAQP
jgi:hypothetical protein